MSASDEKAGGGRERMKKPRLLSQRETDILTGKAMVGAMDAVDQLRLCEHLNLLYHALDEKDDEDFFGTEGWRHHFGIPDAQR
jgi:hypothetical protein